MLFSYEQEFHSWKEVATSDWKNGPRIKKNTQTWLDKKRPKTWGLNKWCQVVQNMEELKQGNFILEQPPS